MDLRMRRDGLDVELMRLMETGSDPEGIPGEPSTVPGNIGNTGNTAWPAGGGQFPSAPPGQQPHA
jgi:hypothetical protein